jgi:phospholipid/cholesterol/gamma-HCH transport system substrate-binding protein
MPSQKEVRWSQLKVGVIVIVSLALLTTLLFLMTSASGMSLFSHKVFAEVYFPNAEGLKKGGMVTLEGVTIGEVKDIEVSTDPARRLSPIHAVLKLDPAYLPSLHTDTTASLSTVGVLGDTVVDLNSETATGPRLRSGDELHSVSSPGISDVVKSSEGTIEGLNTTIARLDATLDAINHGQGTVGQLITNPALYNNANATILELHQVAAALNAGHGSAGKLLQDDSLYNHLLATAANLDTLSHGLAGGKGSAGKLLTDDQLYNNMNSAVGHLNSLLTEADRGHGALGLLAKDPAFAKKLDGTVTQLNTLLTNVNEGKGSLGKFATTDDAHDNLNKLLVNTDGLITAFRANPKKYLSIKLNVF